MSDTYHGCDVGTNEMQRPSVLYRPSIGRDGTKWCVLYGDDLVSGIAGWGDTAAEAMADFDKNWREERTPAAQRLVKP